MFIDTHAHLTSSQVVDLENVLKRARLQQVDTIVNICTDTSTLEAGLKLAEQHPWIYNAAATTPHDVEKEGEQFFPLVEAAARAKKLIAIGETGLDYFYEHSNRKVQQKFLERYCTLACEINLPLIFHCRDAFEDLFAITATYFNHRPALLHCFTGTIAEAQGVLDRGWYLSISGIVTFKKSEELREVVKYVPLDRLVIETDTPYLAPMSKRGQLNEPSYIVETAQMVASLKGIDLSSCAAATSQNAKAFFSFSKVH